MIIVTQLQDQRDAKTKMLTTEGKEEYVKFDGNNKKKFCKWATKMKAIGACQGWGKVLTEDLAIDQESGKEVDRKNVVINYLA